MKKGFKNLRILLVLSVIILIYGYFIWWLSGLNWGGGSLSPERKCKISGGTPLYVEEHIVYPPSNYYDYTGCKVK